MQVDPLKVLFANGSVPLYESGKAQMMKDAVKASLKNPAIFSRLSDAEQDEILKIGCDTFVDRTALLSNEILELTSKSVQDIRNTSKKPPVLDPRNIIKIQEKILPATLKRLEEANAKFKRALEILTKLIPDISILR